MHNEEDYNVRRLYYVDKPSALNDLRTFVQSAVLENLASCSHKEFAIYFHPIEKQQLLLLRNRKIYSTNKQKIQRFEQSKKKDESTKKRSETRAALPSTSTKQTPKISSPAAGPMPQPVAKASQDISQNKSDSSQVEFNLRLQ